MANCDLTAERLRELLNYDPETGVFTWRAARNSNRAPEGKIAGWIESPQKYGKQRRSIEVDQRNYKAHRLAWLYMNGEWPKRVVDHINGDSLDNRIANLRDVSQLTNIQNERAGRRNSRSGLIGAHWVARDSTWSSHIKYAGRLLSLGRFETPEAAHAAYLEAKRRLHKGCTI
jgi:hypothetical protein